MYTFEDELEQFRVEFNRSGLVIKHETWVKELDQYVDITIASIKSISDAEIRKINKQETITDRMLINQFEDWFNTAKYLKMNEHYNSLISNDKDARLEGA